MTAAANNAGGASQDQANLNTRGVALAGNASSGSRASRSSGHVVSGSGPSAGGDGGNRGEPVQAPERGHGAGDRDAYPIHCRLFRLIGTAIRLDPPSSIHLRASTPTGGGQGEADGEYGDTPAFEEELQSSRSPSFDSGDEYASTEMSSNDDMPETPRTKRRNGCTASASRRLKRLRHLKSAGEFGCLELSAKGCLCSGNVVDRLRVRELGEVKRLSKVALGKIYVPSGGGEVVETYGSRAYFGQFSKDGSLFYSCTQDYLLHLYDSSDTRRIRKRKVIQCHEGRWTITDASLSPDSKWLCYSSITPVLWMVALKMDDLVDSHISSDVVHRENEKHIALDLSLAEGSSPSLSYGGPLHFGLWSVRYSGDGREIVAGASDANIYVYDIETRRVLHKISGHTDDVNAVCFAEAAATNVLLSGSDDTTIKVWDRRSIGISGGESCGALVGHTEGITHVASKGDGRYCLSNGKDQQMKLWDIRMMHSASKFAKVNRDFRCDWDYRFMNYPGNPRFRHPYDVSVTTFRGHTVLKTLIRCGFSPTTTTGQAWLYSGSEDGRVHIYDVTGRTVRALDVSEAGRDGRLMGTSSAGLWGSDADVWFGSRRRVVRHRPVVRDVAWHPDEVVLMSSTWAGAHGTAGSVVKHVYDPGMEDSDD